MDSSGVQARANLSTTSCSTPEEFDRMLPDVTRRLIPLGPNPDFLQTDLRLGETHLALVDRPPSVSEGYLKPNRLGIIIPIVRSRGLKLDAEPIDRPSLILHGDEKSHHVFQPNPLRIAAIFLPVERGNRGWPDRARTVQVFSTQATALQQLRSTIINIMSAALNKPESIASTRISITMQHQIMEAIDHAFAVSWKSSARRAVSSHVRICRISDEFIRSCGNRWPTTLEIAVAAGVTIRTLHNATIAVHGMSLQKYMTLKRLWAIRSALLDPNQTTLVKTIALDHGFWHMGRFSRTYYALFGETPSSTRVHATKVYQRR